MKGRLLDEITYTYLHFEIFAFEKFFSLSVILLAVHVADLT